MTINKQALREELSNPAIGTKDHIRKIALVLLDELEAKDAQIANLTVERDALREGEMGDAKHSNTRAAADIYFQLVEECEIPAGGSLVEYVDNMRDELEAAEKRVAELEARELVVNLPAYVDGRTLGYGEVNHMIDLCADAIEKAGHANGIITKVGE